MWTSLAFDTNPSDLIDFIEGGGPPRPPPVAIDPEVEVEDEMR